MKESIIALVDCDSFFVSCEQAANKELQGKPVCVLSNNDGCVIARSREAKKLGITMGMPHFMAKKQFPDAIYLSGNFYLYGDFSDKVMNILRDFSPEVEVYSVDEAFVRLSGLTKLHKTNYLGIAKLIRTRIKEELDINVSVGISKSKVLAKLACEKAKDESKDGVCMISKSKLAQILETTKVKELWGVGRNTAIFFNRWGIFNCNQIVEKSDEWLKEKLGKRGVELKHELMGEYIYKVKTESKLPKSIQNTRSFGKFTSDLNYIKNALNIHIHSSCRKIRRLGGKCKKIAVMLRTKDFRVFWQEVELKDYTNFELEISKAAMQILEKIYDKDLIYRSCGITLCDLDFENTTQMNLFSKANDKNFDKLGLALDRLEDKFGRNVVKTGFTDTKDKKERKKNQEMQKIEKNLSTVSAFSPLNLCSE